MDVTAHVSVVGPRFRYVRAYNASGHRGPQALAAYLPLRSEPDYLPTLTELVRADLKHHWEIGIPLRLSSYRTLYPDLFTDSIAAAELAAEEERLRAKHTGSWPHNSSSSVTDFTPAPAAIPTPFPFTDCTRALTVTPPPPPRPMQSDPEHVPLTMSRSTRPGPTGLGPAARFPTAGETFCGFKLVSELGAGAFARVFLAEQTALSSRPVALKVTTRPTREPQQLAKLRHTNIVPIYSVHDDPPLQAVCMPYLGRRTLADLVKEYRATGVFPGTAAHSTVAVAGGTTLTSGHKSGSHPALPAVTPVAAPAGPPADDEAGHPALVLQLITRLADGLAHAHEVGILHLDLKPANVLLSDDGQPLLLDFNLAFDVRAGDRERAGGTLPYMAPEQLDEYVERGPTRVDQRTDLYALGVIFFELLTGRHPFPIPSGSKANPGQMARARRAGPPSVREFNPSVSPSVESIVRTLLQPDPARRYQSARDLVTDLDRHRHNLPLAIAPDRSLREHFRKWRRRHPRMLTHLLLASAVLALGGVGYAGFREYHARSTMEAVAHARAVNKELAKLRVDLASRDDIKARAAALERGRRVLATYGLPDAAGDWAARPAVRILPEAERTALGDDLGELALLMAHAEWLGGLGKPDAERASAAERALVWNRVAGACYSGRTAPAAVAAQRGRLTAGADPDPMRNSVAARSSTDLYLRAVELMAISKWKLAAKPLEELTTLDPTHFAGQFLLADCRRETGNWASALERYQVAQALAPTDPRPAFHRGRILLTQAKNKDGKDYTAAEAEFTDALRRDTTFADAYRERAVTRTALLNNRGALDDLNAALKYGAAPVQVYSLRALVYDRLDDREAAAQERRAAADLTPVEPVDFVIRGLIRQKDDPVGALADYQRATELRPGYLAAWQNQARVLGDILNQPAKALEAQRKAVTNNPDFGPARAGLAVHLARAGRRDEAHREAQMALTLSSDPDVVYRVACAYARTSANHPDDLPRALSYLRKALQSGFQDFRTIESDPDLGAIRGLVEFQDIVHAARILVED